MTATGHPPREPRLQPGLPAQAADYEPDSSRRSPSRLWLFTGRDRVTGVVLIRLVENSRLFHFSGKDPSLV